jgi:hypothetical protein
MTVVIWARRAGAAVAASGSTWLTVYAVLVALAVAARHEDYGGPLRVLLVLSVVALFEMSRRVPSGLRETGLLLMRGIVVTALFFASADLGPTPEQTARAARDLVVAGLFALLVLLAHARRARAERMEHERSGKALEELIEAVRDLAPNQSAAPPAPTPSFADATALPRSSPVAVAVAVGALGFIVGRRWRRTGDTRP